jgi:acetyl esterase/lipase
MQKGILLLLLLITAKFTQAQTPADFYKKAETSYTAKDYATAATAFADGIRAEGDAAAMMRYRSAAAAFAQAGMADSAFRYLSLIAASSKTNRVMAAGIENGYEFSVLHKDKRWKTTLATLQKKAAENGYVQEEHIYGRKDGMALTMIRIQPKVKANGKAILFVASGGWISGYNGIEANTYLTEQFLVKGYTVFHIVHGSGPRYAIPDNINDLKRAVRFIRYNATRFGIDPNKLGITGGSAGGHLSLMIAMSDDAVQPNSTDPVERVSARVQAAAVLYPPTDLLNWGGPGLNMVNAKDLVKARGSYGAIDFRVWNDKYRIYEEVTDTTARSKIGHDISPIYFISKDDPPVFIIHGDADATVPLQQSKSFVARLNEEGVKNKFIIKKGGRHMPDDMLPEYHEFVNWFDEHLK